MIKKYALMALVAANAIQMNAQSTEVTKKYIENADFGARFAAWTNPGSFTYNVGTGFTQKNGEVFMELWKSGGTKLGNNQGMFQTLRNLPEGTYTLVASAQNTQASSTKAQTGAFIYAGSEQTEISEPGQYNVVFTVTEGEDVTIGVKLQSCTGNWVAIDNFRLFQKVANADSLATRKTALEAEINDLKEKIANATGAVPEVTTNSYVAMGSTICLGRSTIKNNGAAIKEKGLCWSTNPEPTIFDKKTTTYFSSNGNLYRMEGLEPATIYYVRAYALTNGYQLSYGETVKIATLPKGTVSCGYDYAGNQEENYRINSAMQECVWMYNALSNINGLYLNVHYVPGAGAGGGTADCSYGGWMRVSQTASYQQTGTLLHETNHGVGVGTTNEWYNNSDLRSGTSSGKWLGPQATKMVRFLENNEGAYMQGDRTHMWAGTATGTLNLGYGINGAHEDSYQPSNQLLYYGNVLITHAMHQDGLISTSSRGFATPTYAFTQDDNTKYYIKCESADNGGTDAYLTITNTGTLRSIPMDASEVVKDDNFAWNITFDPKTSYYIFQHVGTGKYLTNSSSNIKAASKSSATTTEKFHLMPCREANKTGSFSIESFWILTANGHYAMEGGTRRAATATTSEYYNVGTSEYNASNSATAQRWLLLKAEETKGYEEEAMNIKAQELNELIEQVKEVIKVPHTSKDASVSVADIDEAIENEIFMAESSEDYTSPAVYNKSIENLKTALIQFLADTKVTDLGHPYDLTFLLVNADIDKDCSGWSTNATVNYSCAEFFEKSADFNQTTALKVPKGTYKLMAQAFQRPKAWDATYTDWKAGNSNVKGLLYIKSKQIALKNIYDDASAKKLDANDKMPVSKVYIPNSMEGASKYFAQGLYENEVMVTTTTQNTMKVGIQTKTSDGGSWTIFDNFRLYYYGDYTVEEVETPVKSIKMSDKAPVIYDMMGRPVSRATNKGMYIINGKKVVK